MCVYPSLLSRVLAVFVEGGGRGGRGGEGMNKKEKVTVGHGNVVLVCCVFASFLRTEIFIYIKYLNCPTLENVLLILIEKMEIIYESLYTQASLPL